MDISVAGIRILDVPRNRWLTAMLAAFAVGAVLLGIFDPATSGLFPPCPVRYLTGWYCPGCGSLRAIHQLLHGNWRAAWAMNPLTVVLLPFLSYGLVSTVLFEVRGRELPHPFLPAVWIRALCVAIILFGIARNLPMHPFDLLAPGAMLHLWFCADKEEWMSSFCLGCGHSMSEGERFCGICGKDSQAGSGVPAVDPSAAFGLPPETNGKAIFSLVSGLLFLFPPFSVVAIIFGHLSISEIRKSAGRLTGKGLAIAGLALGYLGVAGFVALMVAAFWSWRAGQGAATEKSVVMNENSVVASVRTLNTAEIAYAQAHRDSGYTCSLPDLVGAWGISGELARGKKNGYVFALQGCAAAKANGPVAKYELVAYPAVTKKTGTPAFCSNESDVIRVDRSGSPQGCLRTGVDLSETEITHPRSW
jgi:hypothetical protein